MFGQFDLALQTIVEATLRDVREQPTLIDDIFDLPEQTREEIRNTFATLDVAVALGYPRDATVLPGVFIVLGAMQEGTQTIGAGFGSEVEHQVAGDVIGDPLYWHDKEGTFVTSTVRLCCWTENANLTVWLQNLVTWGLLRQRSALTESGYIEQRLTATDFEPLPRWFPSFVYRRDVTVTAQHVVTFTQKYRPIAAVHATATSDGESFTAHIER